MTEATAGGWPGWTCQLLLGHADAGDRSRLTFLGFRARRGAATDGVVRWRLLALADFGSGDCGHRAAWPVNGEV